MNSTINISTPGDVKKILEVLGIQTPSVSWNEGDSSGIQVTAEMHASHENEDIEVEYNSDEDELLQKSIRR